METLAAKLLTLNNENNIEISLKELEQIFALAEIQGKIEILDFLKPESKRRYELLDKLCKVGREMGLLNQETINFFIEDDECCFLNKDKIQESVLKIRQNGHF